MDIKSNTWKKALLRIGATLQEAISNLNESGMQICLVTTSEGELRGTITDGDVRRGLLRGFNLNSNIENIMNHNFFVVSPNVGPRSVMELMKINKIRQLPIVNEQMQVIGLHLSDEIILPLDKSNLIIIMAGGQGTRLRPYTENCPKPMLPIGGKPMLEHIIERAKLEGFKKFSLSVHYLGHMIESYFGDGTLFQVAINYIHENKPLGTAGALSLLNTLPEEPFLILNGDIVTDVQYSEILDFHIKQKAVATMGVRRYEWQNPFGVVQTKGVDIIGFEEKPITSHYVNAGVYVLEPSALKFLHGNDTPCDMPTLFERIRNAGLRTIVYPIHESWMDVGRPDDFVNAQKLEYETI